MNIWKTLRYNDEVFENYEISTEGIVRNKKTQISTKTHRDKDGYNFTTANNYLGKSILIKISRAMMFTFCPLESYNGLVVNHMDLNKQNDTLENLEWCTLSENTQHGFDNFAYKDKIVYIIAKDDKIYKLPTRKKLIDLFIGELGYNMEVQTINYHISNCIKDNTLLFNMFYIKEEVADNAELLTLEDLKMKFKDYVPQDINSNKTSYIQVDFNEKSYYFKSIMEITKIIKENIVDRAIVTIRNNITNSINDNTTYLKMKFKKIPKTNDTIFTSKEKFLEDYFSL